MLCVLRHAPFPSIPSLPSFFLVSFRMKIQPKISSINSIAGIGSHWDRADH